MAYCKKVSHIKKNVRSCKIATHFIDECCDEEIPFKYLAFVIINVVNNTSGLMRNQVEDYYSKKKLLFIIKIYFLTFLLLYSIK